MINAQMPWWSEHLFRPKRYKVFYGGRGAGRSWNYARALLIMGGQVRLRILCCRELQKSIADSVHKLLQDQILLLQLPGWKVTNTTITHVGTGTAFIFEGLRYNTNRIKSLEGIDICWVEEAESVTKENWEVLIPTIRKPGSEIWISFNPYLEDDPTYQRFVIESPPNAVVMKIGWESNPWFPDTLREEMEYLYRVDPDAAEHVWGGVPKKTSAAQILHNKWSVEAFEPDVHWAGPFYGCDFGFAKDPTAAVEVWIRPDPRKVSLGSLMIRRESYHVGLETDKIARTWRPIFGNLLWRHVIRADNARPETISYLNRHGIPKMKPVFKWKGSVEDGIAYLRQFEKIVIHPDCPNARQEAKLWSYKVDANSLEILPQVLDKHNHIWDAVRYALVTMIRTHRMKSSTYRGVTYAGA